MFATVHDTHESPEPLPREKLYVLRALAEKRGDRERQNAIECRIDEEKRKLPVVERCPDEEKPATLVSCCCVSENRENQRGRG